MNLTRRAALHLTALCIAVGTLVAGSVDYYNVLGVSRTATAKEIRVAFKKLVVRMHPDKNKGDAEAHEKFLKITRAYEILKDEELRRKYDVMGEEGLKDEEGSSERGQRYESWQFYREEFGIYDEDREIITLTRSDFETSVQNSDDIWFINFYSPHCSHCHHLAPTWREVARELEGVVRVGAVNCEDEYSLCSNQNIRGYPSLVIYPEVEKFRGKRTKEGLVQFVLQRTSAAGHVLTAANFDELAQGRATPWLVTVCGRDADCFLSQTVKKLAVMLAGLVSVGTVDCHWQATLCSQLSAIGPGGSLFLPHGLRQLVGGGAAGDVHRIESLYTQEVGRAVLERLPAMEELDPARLEALQANCAAGHGPAYLVRFYQEASGEDIELRKLPVILAQSNIKTGQMSCAQHRSACNGLALVSFPKFLLFKSSGHEHYYGRMTSHDLTNFARDSASNPMVSLLPADFAHHIAERGETWLVEFFAPWCPPCMRLLPKFKGAAAESQHPHVHFGTVDCTVHRSLCREHNVRSYPTTVLFNATVPHAYHGPASTHHLLEFLDDILHPRVVALTPDTFDAALAEQAERRWLVDFFAPWCAPCQSLAGEWRQVAKMFAKKENVIKVGSVDCQQFNDFCRQRLVRAYPTIRLYHGQKNYWQYTGWHRDADSIHRWTLEFLPSKVRPVRRRFFDTTVLPSATPWLIDFYAPWCGACQEFAPTFERIGEMLPKLRLGKVNCDEEAELCRRADVTSYPTVALYPGRHGRAAGLQIDSMDADEIVERVHQLLQSRGTPHDEL